MAQNLQLTLQLKAIDKATKPFKTIISSAKRLEKSMSSVGGELKNMQSLQRSVAGYKKLGKEYRNNDTKIKSLTKEIEHTARAQAQADKVTKKAAQTLESKRKQLNQLKTTQIAHKQQLSQTRAKLQGAGIDTKKLATSEAHLKSRIDQANTSLKTQNTRLNTLRQTQRKLARAKSQYEKSISHRASLSFVGAAGYASGARILGGVASLLRPGIGFDEQMSSVGALARLDKTSTLYKQLRKQAQDLGASTQFSASEAAQGMQYLARAGFDASKILTAMPGMLDLAKAGNLDLAVTADIASNILSGFKLEASQMNVVGDVLAATFTRSNVDLEQLGETMKYVAPIANKAGASIQEAAALSGLLGNIGIQGSMAGTTIRALYNRMAAPPKEARDAIAAIGLKTQDASGNLRAMPEILADIAKKTEHLGNAKQLEIFSAIAGTRAGAGLAELASQGGAGAIEKFVEILKQSEGESSRIARQMSDNAAGDIKAMQSAWEGLNITITDTNMSPMREFIQSVSGVIRKINMWVKDNPVLAGQLIKGAAILGALILVMGGLSLAIAGVLGPLVLLNYGLKVLFIKAATGKIITLFAAALGILKKSILATAAAQKILNFVMTANPIGLVIAAVVSLIAIIGVLYFKWDEITAWFAKKFEWLTSKFAWLTKATKGFKSLWQSITGDDVNKTLTISQQTNKLIPQNMQALLGVSQPAIAGVGNLQNHSPLQPVKNTVHHHAPSPTHITVNAAPGMDEGIVAQQVAKELKRADDEKQSRARSKLYDE